MINDPNNQNNNNLNGAINFNVPNNMVNNDNVNNQVVTQNVASQDTINNMPGSNIQPLGTVTNNNTPNVNLNNNMTLGQAINTGVPVSSPISNTNQQTNMNNTNQSGATLASAINNPSMNVNNIPNNVTQNNAVNANNGMPQGQNSNTVNVTTVPNQTVNIPSTQTDEEKTQKKVSPIVVIAAVLLLVVGVGSLYYFVLDKPNKVFSTAFNKFFSSVSVDTVKNKFTNYDINININTENEQYKYYTDIINKLSINATVGIDNDNNVISNGLINYNNGELLNYSALYNQNNAYLKANNFLDKVIKIDLNDESNGISSNQKIEENDLTNIRTSIINAINKAMDSANYKKELVELNGSRVKKYTLVIDKTFINNISSTLSNDTTFLNTLSKLSGENIDEIKKSLDTTNEDIDTSEINIYTGLIKSEFLKLELTTTNALLTVTKDNDNYNYEYTLDNELLYKGYITYKNMGNDATFNFKAEIINEATTVNISCTTSIFDDITPLDISSAITVDELTEEDMTTIMEKYQNNQILQTLMTDLGLNEDSLDSLMTM